jgi:TolA-binding protein
LSRHVRSNEDRMWNFDNPFYDLSTPHSALRFPLSALRLPLWSLVTIGWWMASGISPCAGEPFRDLSSLSASKTSVSGNDCQESFQQATRWYREAEWERAAHAFARSALQASDFQQRWVALFYEAECLVQTGDYRGAHLRYDAMLGETSSHTLISRAQFRQAQFRRGETAWLAGHADQAEIALQQFAQQYPSDPLTARALLALGDLAIVENQLRQAVSYYRRILEQFPGSFQVVAARLGLAHVLLAQGKPERAIVAVEPLTTTVQGPGEAWLLLARACYRQGRFEEALAKVRKFQTHFEQDDLAPQTHLVAAWALWRLGRLDQITDELAPLDTNSRWESEVQTLRGMTAYAQKKWSEAARLLCSAALTEKPPPQDSMTQDALLYYAGESSRRAGQFEQARECIHRLLKEVPESEWLDDALQMLRRIDQNGRNMEVTEQLEEAQQLQRDGHFDAAVATYHTLLDRLPGDSGDLQMVPVLLWRSGRLHERLGQFIEARPLYEQLLMDYPDDPHAAGALFRLGEMARHQGCFDQAAPYYRKVHAKFPQTAQAREAAYWLALRAADNQDSPAARCYTNWLLAELAAETPGSTFQSSRPEDTGELLLELASKDRQEAPLPSQHSQGRGTNLRRQQLLAHTLYLQSQLAAREGQWKQLRTLIIRLLEVVPEGELQTAARFWLAESEFRLGHDEVALRRFRELVPRVVGLDEPWVPMVSLRRAQLAAERQQWTYVLKWTDKLRHDWPEFPLAHEADYLRGRALAGRGEMSAARIAYQRVLESSRAEGTETAAMAQWMIGETYFHQHQYQRAREAYVQVIDNRSFASWQTLAALQAGKCWELEGDWDQARKLYADALQRHPDAPPAKQLQARLRWAERHTDSKY